MLFILAIYCLKLFYISNSVSVQDCDDVQYPFEIWKSILSNL
jgi:hypothetical protein